MEQFYTVLTQVGIFLIFILLGVLSVKAGIVDEHSLGSISKIVMRLALPAYIFLNTAEGATRQGLGESLLVVPLAVGLYVILFGLSRLLERLFRLEGNRAHVFRAVVMFGNVGFMGIPLVVELYPHTALLYISLFTIIDQVLFWTYGVFLTRPVTGERERISPAGLKNLLSPALAAILLATVFVLLDIHLPPILNTTLEKLGGASMPLSLLYIGGMLALTDIRKGLGHREIYGEIALKMLVLPLAFYGLMRLFGVPEDMGGTLAFLAGLPAINMVAMLSKNNGSDGEYAVCAVMMTTVACLVTLPLVSLGMSLVP